MGKMPVSGFPRALLFLAVMRKRALESRLSVTGAGAGRGTGFFGGRGSWQGCK